MKRRQISDSINILFCTVLKGIKEIQISMKRSFQF